MIVEVIAIEKELDKERDLFRNIIDNISELIALTDLEGNFTFVGTSHSILGYELDSLPGSNVFELVHPDDLSSLLPPFREMLERKSSKRVEYRCRCADGSYIWLETVGKVLLDGEGSARELLFTSRDISERRRMEETLRAAKENAEWLGRQAEAANRAKSAFLANTSHELRTPLNGVTGFLELLAQTKLDRVQREYLDCAAVSAQSLLEVIGNVLDISKIESGRLELESVLTDLPELLRQALQVVRSGAERKKLHLNLKLEDSDPRCVYLDSVRVKQVLVNLLANAVKFTHKGSVELSVDFSDTQDGNGAFTFSVKDTGIGIDEKVRKRIFEPFSQADASTTRLFGGTGLGLTICETLLKMMGSELELESAPGEGSRFFFTLRAAFETGTSAADVGDALDMGPSEELFIPIRTEKTPVLLIVEDQRLNRRLLRLIALKLLPDAIAFEAADGAEGVELFLKHEPDLVLMDLQMPRKDGFQAAREIRALESAKGGTTPIVALTGDTFQGTMDAAFESGMDDFLTKPIEHWALREILERYLGEKP